MNVHEESHAVLKLLLQQRQLLFVTASGLDLGIGYNNLREGRSRLRHIHRVVLVQQRLIVEQIGMIRMTQLMRQCRHIGRRAAVSHEDPRFLAHRERNAESSRTLGRTVLCFNPAAVEGALGEGRHLGTEFAELGDDFLRCAVVRDLAR
ncbi:hypothetical protein D3C73_1308240 [compost metagenome]